MKRSMVVGVAIGLFLSGLVGMAHAGIIIDVYSTSQSWVDTDIYINQGNWVSISASGLATNNKYKANINYWTPDGYPELALK